MQIYNIFMVKKVRTYWWRYWIA